jgi:hypothetical protein
VDAVIVLSEPAKPSPAEPKRESPAAAANVPAPMPKAVPPQSIGELQGAKQKEQALAAKQIASDPRAPAAQEKIEITGSRVQLPGIRAKRDAATGAAARTEADDATLSPEEWVKRIVELQRQGKMKEAAEELKKFKKRYPDYALPADLRDLR